MKKNNYEAIATIIIIVVICAFLFITYISEKRQSIKDAKYDMAYEIFIEQVNKQNLYTKKYLDAFEKSDIKTMELYLDSLNMAFYCSENAYYKMKLIESTK